MNHHERWGKSQEESFALSRLVLRALLIAAAVLGLQADRSAAYWSDDDAYPVGQVRAFAAGKWHVARLIPGGTTPQFVVDFEPGWPTKISLEVTWGSELIALDSLVAKNQLYCRDLSSAVSRIKVEVYVSSGWQALPGHPTYVPIANDMRYTLSNVDRTSPLTVRASCEYNGNDVHHFSGAAKIRFEPKDPLSGWNPGLPKDITDFSIVSPDEGQSMSSTKGFSALVKCPPCADGSSGQITLEVEKATKYQTGTVGDLALPPGKPYVTEWKKIASRQYSIEALFFDAKQIASLHLPGSLSEKAVRTATAHHDPGWYRLRLMSGSKTTPWRTFQIYNPIPLMPKAKVAMPKAMVTPTP
jgi:hypothetical protein